MITDPAVFRDPNYHRRSDTAEEMDFDRLARVVDGLETMLTRLTQQ